MPTRDAVWITGVGTANPLGNTYETTADHLLAGRSCVRSVTQFDVSKHRCKIMAPIDDVPVPFGWSEAEFRRFSSFEQLLLWCSARALQDAGWWEKRGDSRVGLVLGLGGEWIRTWEVDNRAGGNRGAIRSRTRNRSSTPCAAIWV